MRLRFALVLVVAGCSGSGGDGGDGCPDPVIATENEQSASMYDGGHLVAEAADLTEYATGTIEAWVSHPAPATGDLQIFGKGPASAPAFAMFAEGGEDIAAGFADPGWDSDFATGAPIPADGTWTHLAVAWNSSSLSFFVDGQVLVNTTTLTGPQTQSADPFFIGGGLEEGLVGSSWEGAIDEVRFWGVERLGGDILGDMTSMLEGTEPGLLAYWNFEDATGPAADVTGTCHTARMEGLAQYLSATPF